LYICVSLFKVAGRAGLTSYQTDGGLDFISEPLVLRVSVTTY
jgi:hypothetical protein